MTTAVQPAGGAAGGPPSSSSLADVVDTILDKGLSSTRMSVFPSSASSC